MMNIVSESFVDYLNENWYDRKETWAYPVSKSANVWQQHKQHNRSIFHWLTGAVHSMRRSASSISELVKILLKFCCEKVIISSFQWLTNVTPRAVVRVDQALQSEFRELG